MKTSHPRGRQQYSRIALRFLLVLVAVSLLSMVFPVFAQGGTITGNVYKDFNASGTRTALAGGPGTAGEPGVAGVVVTAFGATGATVGTAVTNADGDYTLTVSSADTEVRLEFGGLPTYLRCRRICAPVPSVVIPPLPSPSYLSLPQVSISRWLIPASTATQATRISPSPATTSACYDFGPAGGVPPNNNPSVTTFPYQSGSTSQVADSGAATVGDTALASSAQVGATWGVAYNRPYGQLYVSAFTKRHVGFGPAGPGGIYVIDPATNAISILITLAAGADPHDTLDYLIDDTAWNEVGRRGLGDIDVSDDGRTLYAVNFFTNTIQTINIGVGGRTATLGASIPSPAPCAGARLGGLKYHRGQLYYGVTCTSGTLQSFVYRAGAQVATIPLNYDRGNVSDPLSGSPQCQTIPTGPNCGFWRPWATVPTDNPGTANDIPAPMAFNQEFHPQPLLMDIEFDADNFMIVGMMDRYGHQSGFPIGGSAAGGGLFANREGVSAGDILRLSPNGAGTAWTLESNGSDGRVITLGAGNNQGPGGGEFYFHDRYLLSASLHDGPVSMMKSRWAVYSIWQVPGKL